MRTGEDMVEQVSRGKVNKIKKFFSGIIERIDKKMQEKAKNSGSCCGSDKNKEKKSCCS